jgi:Mn-dependent DtxR family transcriptional regulator
MTADRDPERLALAWRLALASVAFILRIREVSRRDNDLIDSLLFASIISANLALVNRDAGLQLAYAGVDEPAPDELRRPVSINAVAQSLRIPFETARRRVRRLARRRLVEIQPRGVIVPATIINDPDFMQSILARHKAVGEFYATVRALGALPEMPPGSTAGAASAAPVRLTNRVSWEYLLRMADEMMAMVGDPLSALLLLEVIRRNAEGFGPAELAAWARDPLAHARPARTVAFARHLRLSPETARRHMVSLEAAGFCRRTSRGVVATLPSAQAPALERLVLDNLANVQRMFARLSQLGALQSFAPARPLPATLRA